MVKKIFALVMVISVLGVMLGGCSSGDAGTAGDTGTTTGTDAKPADPK
jgi:hypothetical protein